MVDVLKTLDIEYIAANPASSFRSLQESLINYGSNSKPEWLTCMHEESSVGMARGYFKIENKPMAAIMHGVVGLQHAAIAIYHAFCDRVPVYLILGNTFDATERRPGAEWRHSVQDAAGMVRDYIKWDDMPVSLEHFAESAVRAYKIMMTPPMLPVALVADSELQERPMEAGARHRIPKLTIPKPPAGDPGAVAEIARMLVAAEYPVITGGRLGNTANSLRLLVELAETLQCPASGGKFPSLHPLNGGDVGQADLVLALEPPDLWNDVNTMTDQLVRTTRVRSEAGRQDRQHLHRRSLHEEQLPGLPAVPGSRPRDRGRRGSDAAVSDRSRQTPDHRRPPAVLRGSRRENRRRPRAGAGARAQAGGRGVESQSDQLRPRRLRALGPDQEQGLVGASAAACPAGRSGISTSTTSRSPAGRARRSGIPCAVGAALANKKYGRLSINIQNDGDLMYAPGVLWTAAHHRIPMLTIMNNNRGYHQEVMHLQRMACRHNRDLTNGEDRHRDRGSQHRLRQAGGEHGVVRRRTDHRIPTMWGRRSGGRSPGSKRASPPCSIPSCSRAEGGTDEEAIRPRHLWRALFSLSPA